MCAAPRPPRTTEPLVPGPVSASLLTNDTIQRNASRVIIVVTFRNCFAISPVTESIAGRCRL
ncbi:protein of unknown function [Cupriavidus taiwanensis]|nr:protein of unknown function [Cupriavidus taiwanensis]